MKKFGLNDVVEFHFVNKEKTVSCDIKATIIAIMRDKDNAENIKAYSLSINPKDIPNEVKALKTFKYFVEPISFDDISDAKKSGNEIFTSMPDIVGKTARWVKPDAIVKLIKSEDDDEREKRRQINFFFKDILTEWVPNPESGLKYL
jgi:hypothetical protein